MGLIDRSLAGRRVHPALWITAGLMVAAELLFAAVDVGLIGQDAGRGVGYALFGYWDIAFEHWRATGELHPQLIWSYLTHAFLHGGWLHLLMNAAALLGLGHAVSQLVGIRSFALIFLGTAVSGALVYSLITDYSTSVQKVLPFAVHLMFDFAAALALVAAPFLFGFDDIARYFYLTIGVAVIAVVLVTSPDIETAQA